MLDNVHKDMTIGRIIHFAVAAVECAESFGQIVIALNTDLAMSAFLRVLQYDYGFSEAFHCCGVENIRRTLKPKVL